MAKAALVRSSTTGAHIALSFLMVLVTAPPVMAAVGAGNGGVSFATMIILALIAILLTWVTVRAPTLDTALTRGLVAAGTVLLAFPIAFAVGTIGGFEAAHWAGAEHSAGDIARRNFILAYDLAIGISCVTLSWMIFSRDAAAEEEQRRSRVEGDLRNAFDDLRAALER